MAVVAAAVVAVAGSCCLLINSIYMYTEMSFDEWFAKVKTEYAKAGLELPEDIELMELAHMECRAEEKSIEEFIEDMKKEQGK